MKIYRIILIIFVLLSIYTMRHDIGTALSRIYNFINKQNIENTSSQDNSTTASSTLLNISDTIKNSGTLTVIKKFRNQIIAPKSNLNATDIISATNKERVSHGLSPLIENGELDISSQNKATDMLTRQYFEHQSPDGKGVTDLVEAQGYEYILVGENLALGNFENSDAVVTAWMNSPGHRANILNFRYTEIGVGIVKGNYQGNVVWFAVQHFGLPRNACPFVSETIKNQVENNQIKLAQLEKSLTALKGEVTNPSASQLTNYSEKIKSYNNLVDQYNKLVSETKKLVQEYNAEVKSFNNCASSGN